MKPKRHLHNPCRDILPKERMSGLAMSSGAEATLTLSETVEDEGMETVFVEGVEEEEGSGRRTCSLVL